MKRPDFQTMIRTLGVAGSAVGIHNYYLMMNQPKPSDQVAHMNKGFDEMRTMLTEQRAFYEKRQFQSRVKEDLLNNQSDRVENLINKMKEGKKIDTKTDPDFQALTDLQRAIKEIRADFSNTSEVEQVINETGKVTQEQIPASLSNPTNSADLLSNNNLTAEFTNYIKTYNDWVSGLEIEQVVYVVNISVLLTVFSLTITLMSIFYSDWLITRFNIEKRFPRIGRIVRLRRTIQNYSFFINSLIIFALIIPAFAINVHALINSFSN